MERPQVHVETVEQLQAVVDHWYSVQKKEIERLVNVKDPWGEPPESVANVKIGVGRLLDAIKELPEEKRFDYLVRYIDEMLKMQYPVTERRWSIEGSGDHDTIAHVIRRSVDRAITILSFNCPKEKVVTYLLSFTRSLLEDRRTIAGTNMFSHRVAARDGLFNAEIMVRDIVQIGHELKDETMMRGLGEIFADPVYASRKPSDSLGSPPFPVLEKSQKKALEEKSGNSYYFALKKAFALGDVPPSNLWREGFLTIVRAKNQTEARQYIDGIAEWMQRSPMAIFSRFEIVKALKRLDADYALQKMKGMFETAIDKSLRELLLYVFDNITDARLPVTNTGVTYSGTHYDLGQENISGQTAQRLTPDGKVGVFAHQGNLKKYFGAVRSAPIDETVKADVKDITVDDLFYPDASDTAKTRAEKEKMKRLFLSRFRDECQHELGIAELALNDFSLREQAAFVTAFAHSQERECERIINFLCRFKERGMKALLSVQFQPEKLPELLDLDSACAQDAKAKERVSMVLRGFWDLTDLAIGISDDLLEKYVVQDRGQKVNRRRLEEEIMRRGSAALMKYATIVATKPVSERNIRRAIRAVTQDVVLLGAMLRSAFQGKHEINFAELKDIEVSNKTLSALRPTEQTQMRTMFRQNWEQTKPEAFASMQRDMFPQPESDLSETVSYSLLKRKNALLAYLRFEPDAREPNALRADYLNVEGGLQDSGIGCAFLKETLDKRAQEQVIRAEFFPEANVGSLYIEKFGFIGTGIGSEPQGSGEKQEWIEIRRDDQAKMEFVSRLPEVTLQEIKRWTKEKPPQGVTVWALRSPRGTFTGEDLTRRMQKESQRRPAAVLTRYVIEKEKDVETRYFVFEVLPASRSSRKAKSQR